ncbi:hypothetical protein EXIGLDRAFT_837222 [Exidia glandulosa HHB12029]|uniref:Uncharacterized protein n=1 Tax=Exidia glandulosa HHB12029 TaxID=1314781 RepID=A0A165H080_EXIGL|nr:hypothetical protein EXIGLDRAFT_837222 [Exidia glandulosa HHB12029]
MAMSPPEICCAACRIVGLWLYGARGIGASTSLDDTLRLISSPLHGFPASRSSSDSVVIQERAMHALKTPTGLGPMGQKSSASLDAIAPVACLEDDEARRVAAALPREKYLAPASGPAAPHLSTQAPRSSTEVQRPNSELRVVAHTLGIILRLKLDDEDEAEKVPRRLVAIQQKTWDKRLWEVLTIVGPFERNLAGLRQPDACEGLDQAAHKRMDRGCRVCPRLGINRRRRGTPRSRCNCGGCIIS